MREEGIQKESSSFVSTTPEYTRALEMRTPGSTEWIFAIPGYANWASASSEGSKILWINAPDGLGKTILAARIVQELSLGGEAPVAYFFSSHEDSIRRVTTNILRSWIDQLSALSEGGGKAAQGSPEDKFGKEDLWQILGIALQGIRKSYLVLDGLDECLDYAEAARSRTSGVRGVFLRRLLDVIHTTGVRLCILSRDVSDIRSAIEEEHDRSLDPHSVVEIPAGPGDFAADSKLLANEIVEGRFGEQTPELRRELIEGISLKSGGSMLWVRRAVNLLKPWMSEDQLKETLSSLPTSLPQLYKNLLGKVIELDKEERDRAKEIFRWTLFAERPLSIKELTEALMMRDGDASFPKERLPPCIDEGYINSQILGLCAGLIEVRRQGTAPEAWTIHIAHSSIKDFLTKRRSKKEREDLGRLSKFIFSDYHFSHGILANTCLSYSMLEDIHMVATMVGYDSSLEWPPPLPRTSPSLSKALKPYSLLQYATSNWALHAQQNVDYDAALYPRISAVLSHPRKARKHGISRPAYHSPEWHRVLFLHEHAPAPAEPISPLDTCARFGILHGVKLLLRNITPASHPEVYVRALWIAVYYHHPSLVTFLLAKGADVNATGNLGSAVKFGSALHIAVKFNFTSIAQVLISHGAKVNARVGEYGTILNTAVASGNEQIVEVLLDAGADPSEAPTRYGNALVLAVAMRKNLIAELLLSRGADIHAQCGAFGNALSVAACGGDGYMVEMLLERGAEVNSIGGFYGTALQAAAAKGELQAVNMLIGAGADINVVAGHYGSALRAAKKGGFAEVSKVLVEAGAIE